MNLEDYLNHQAPTDFEEEAFLEAFFLLGLDFAFLDFSLASITVESLEICEIISSPNAFLTRDSCTRCGNSILENSSNALEKVDSLGISDNLSHPQILLKFISLLKRSIKKVVVSIL